ncbi:MAG: M28 family peptidase [Lacibacter sp.]|jgi:Iap family predicted aminopeptidase
MIKKINYRSAFSFLKALKILMLLQVLFTGSKAQLHLFDSIFLTPSQINYYVSALAHDSMQGRATGTDGMLKAAHFIAKQMKAIGLQPVKTNDAYFHNYGKLSYWDKHEAINVIGAIPGSSKPDELVIFSAHYDHIGKIKSKKDSVFNGANDNASGTALLLQLASYYIQTKPERTILFIAFSGEELGLKGSEEFAASIDEDKVRAVINFDMVGRSPKKNIYMSGTEYGDVQSVMNKELFTVYKEKFGKNYFKGNAPVVQFFSRSDNYPFAVKGIPAHTISATPDNDRYYHQLTDETATLDFELINDLVKTIFIATQPIVNGSVKLRRIRVN